jgi:hypothetical protein
MRIVKAISVPTLVLAATTLTLAGGAAPAHPTAKPRATVALVDTAPLTVAGRGFARSDRVTVRATVGNRSYVRVVRANAVGRFVVQLATPTAECSPAPFAVSAVGRSGRSAAMRRIEIPPPCGVVIQP